MKQPVDEISIHITYARMPPLNAHAGVSISTRGLNIDLILYLHPYFDHASSEGSVESAHMRKHASAFPARFVGKYQNLLCCPMYFLI